MRTYGVLKLCGDDWLMGGLDPHVKIKLKALFPQIPKGAGGPYRFGNTPVRCADIAWFESRYPMAMSPEDREALQRQVERNAFAAAEIERIRTEPYSPPLFAGLREGQAIREHQGRAVAQLERVDGLLVGDEVGEGKTYTTGAACLLPEALPAIIVCMPHLKDQWCAKLREFTTLRIEVLKGTKPYPLPDADVRILGYTQLSGWADVLEDTRIGLIAFDEMQELRRGDAADKGRAAIRLAERARFRLGLTATPIYNYGDEIWQVMRFLRPEVLGEREDFLREWCTALGNGKHRVNDPRALGTYLRDCNAFTRKTKDGRKPSIIVREVDHSVDALAQIEDVARALALTASTGAFTERGEAVRELDMRVRQATGIAKARSVARAVRLMVEAGEPVVLFGWHREVYNIWLAELADLRPAMFTGSETPKAKAAAIEAFVGGYTKLMIMSLRSGAGVDGLQMRAATAVFGELDWSPGVHHQCIGRLDREGQTEPVTAIYLVAEDGSDPPIMEVLGVKASQASNIVDPSLGVQAAHADDSRLRGLIDRYLKTREAA